jgi:S-formylglutathione hydrolase FrmB
MGGYGAMKCALTFPERFSKVGAFSAMYSIENYINRYKSDQTNPYIQRARQDFYAMYGKDLDKVEEGNLHLLVNAETKYPEIYISCGLDDMLLPETKDFHDILIANNIDHTYEIWEGNHEWNFWALSLKRMFDKFFS